jgi:hypothetical protein
MDFVWIRAVGEQFLGDETSEGVTNQDRLCRGHADEFGVVVDRLRDADVVHCLGMFAGLGHGRCVAGPAWRCAVGGARR